MRKALAILILVTLLGMAIGCSGPGDTTTTGTKTTGTKDTSTAKYAGFMGWKAGMWSETKVTTGSQKTTMRTEIIENSATLVKFQTTTEAAGQKVVAQIWINPQGNKPMKYVMKTAGMVNCMDVSNMPQDAVPSDGSEYPADMPDVKYGTYTTPTGKTLAVAKYTTDQGETWVSSEVPFGLVKMVQGGKAMIELQDFGTIGAKSLISDSEVSNCQDLSAMMKKAQASMPTQDDDEPEDAPDYSTTIKEAGTGQTVPSFSCSQCDSMPDMAKNACLAACK